MQVKKQQLELEMEQQTGSKLGKENVYCLLNLYAEHIMRNVGLDEAQAKIGIKIARRNINNLRYADDTTLTAEREELKLLLMKVKEESKKVDLKLHILKTKMMTSGPITSWQIDREIMEIVTDFILGAPKSLQMVTAAMKLKGRGFLGRKPMINLDSILKSRDITFANKGLSSQSYGFSSSHVCM